MIPAPPTAFRICTLLCLLLVTDKVLASYSNVTFSPGDTVTLRCSEETISPRNLTLIKWRKENGSHFLRLTSDGNKTASNFTDPRISFLSAQLHLVLQIRDARPEDAGNYSCEVTLTSGIFYKSWTLHKPDPTVTSFLIYVYCSVPGAVILIAIIAGIIYCKCCTNHKTGPSRIHQTGQENTQKEEPIYDNAHEDYFLRFNTLYDTTQTDHMARRANNP